jgi:riboflavin kinase/FMN adenylyltransferase
MKIVRSFGPIETEKPAVVMAIGFFDGVHLGHQRVISLCREQAAAENAEAWVMTFDPHPLKVLRPHTAPRLITTPTQKLEYFEKLNIDGVMVVPFTPEFSQLTPDEFLSGLFKHIPNLRGIVVGQNWHFGRNAGGNAMLLRYKAAELPFKTTITEPQEIAGHLISSSRIRAAISTGQLADAQTMLGRNHAVRGTVIDGLKRGRRLGFPTANLDLTGYALPPHGIYAARIHRHGQPITSGAVYLPANAEANPGLLEVHIIDLAGDLYGQELTVELITRIREDNLRFECEADLIRQIASDVNAIRKILDHHD